MYWMSDGTSVTLITPTILDTKKIISNFDKAYVYYGEALVSDFPNVETVHVLFVALLRNNG